MHPSSNPKALSIHEYFMQRALDLARRGWGDTHPNPMVGAVVVEDGKVVSEGWHARAGEAHAERMALDALGRAPTEDAILYITLEPCSTTGRTPPCTERIVESGIKKVVFGAFDPNPAHAGRGLDILLEKGLSVTCSTLVSQCEDLNLIFNHRIVKNEPFIAAKIATTLDGKIATRTGHSKWITGEAARRDVHRWRRYFPAIAVGSGTILADNPSLTARLENDVHCPWRIVFDYDLRSAPSNASVYTDAFASKTIVVHDQQAPASRLDTLQERGVRLWELPHTQNRPHIPDFKARCLEENIDGVLVEGGRSVLSHLLKNASIDYLFHYRAPILLGDADALEPFTELKPESMQAALRLDQVKQASFANDQLIRGFVVAP